MIPLRTQIKAWPDTIPPASVLFEKKERVVRIAGIKLNVDKHDVADNIQQAAKQRM
jgi:hypothetical protein